MKFSYSPFFNLFFLLVFSVEMQGEIFLVNSQQSFNEAHQAALANDSIIWESGSFSDIYMNITKDHIHIAAEELGGTVFTGTSRVKITGDYITLIGLQFVGGNIGTNDVINTSGSFNIFDQINIRAYTSYKYLVIRAECQYVSVIHCNFENRLNLDDKNILSILVDANKPGYHKIQYCSFKNFDGTGNDMGIEPIRIGLSTQANYISRSLVEYCYFTQCNGDGEIISNKARQNVFRYNTFEDNPKAELVLRHGSESIVYGNFFLNGKGGIRVREGQQQFIYNNYFYELDDRAIYLQNDDSDPLEDIHIAFNTIINCEALILGGDGNYKPENVTLANNIFSEPKNKLFEDPTGLENWIGNLAFGDPGIALPSEGIISLDPEFEKNVNGFYELSESSPAINAAKAGYTPLPQFEGIDQIDSEIVFDLMGQERPQAIEEKDLGCSEYPPIQFIKPHATEENTGPNYNTSTVSKVFKNDTGKSSLFQIFPNPVKDKMKIKIDNTGLSIVQFNILDVNGKLLRSSYHEIEKDNVFYFSFNLNDFPASLYHFQSIGYDLNTNIKRKETKVFIKQ